MHVGTFERLAAAIDDRVPIHHEVQEGLLSAALAAGSTALGAATATAEVVQALVRAGANVIVCTCSTIGGIAEGVPVPDDVLVMRIDRPMAEQAVASDRRIVVVATLESTLEPTVALLRQIAAGADRAIEVVEIFADRAWELFERGLLHDYFGRIAEVVEAAVLPTDLVLLAQASMAAAAERMQHLGVPVLSSPRLGVEAAMARYRARTPRSTMNLALEWEGLDGSPLPPAAKIIDDGLEQFNQSAADFTTSLRFACVARLDSGTIAGGAVARWWGQCCELQQLWVDEHHRNAGLGRRLVQRVEAEARNRGCSLIYCDTFSFQAPAFYAKLGYEVACEFSGFPGGVSKFVLRKSLV